MKDVTISIVGLTGCDDNGNEIEFITDGKYAYNDEKASFEYMESELTGMEGSKTTFSVEPDLVTITRDGMFSSQMVFREGEKHYFSYNTPFGAINMSVDTQSVRSALRENGGTLEVKYILDMEGSAVSRNFFEINIRENNTSLRVL